MCGETNQGENLHRGVTKVSITHNMMHYEGVPVSSYYVIAEFASVQIIFGATVCTSENTSIRYFTEDRFFLCWYI